MNDFLYDFLMVAFFGAMVGVVLYKPVHTGLLGSLGCVFMGASALLACDDSMYTSVEHIQGAILLFCAGAGMAALHAVLTVSRAKMDGPDNVPRRRRTDYGEFDEHPHVDERRRIGA